MDKPEGIYLGVDPGESGGLAVVGSRVAAVRLPETERDIWLAIKSLAKMGRVKFALIEEQTPRPTNIFDPVIKKVRPTILKSTCILYGNYCRLRAMLTAADIPFEDILPKKWQKIIGIPARDKGEDKVKWKNRLKSKAQALYPDLLINLSTSDAVLLAETARRMRERIGG